MSIEFACTISKRYTKRASYPYWYAYHPQWDEFLDGGSKGYLALGCMDLSIAFAIPRVEIIGILDDLNTTETTRGLYWHLHIIERSPEKYELLVPRRTQHLDLKPYEVSLAEFDA